MTGAFGVLAAAVVAGESMAPIGMFVAATAALAAWHRTLLRWPSIIAFVVGLVLLVPFGRYTLPSKLPFNLELYRLVVAGTIVLWVAALLADPRVRLRRTPFDLPLGVIAAATVGSVLVNIDRVRPLESAVVKAVTFFLSFILFYYLVVSVVRSARTVEALTKLLVSLTAAVAVFAVIEQRTGANVFDHVGSLLPFLRFEGPLIAERDGLTRAVASAQHPIALGVLFAMVFPIALGLALGISRRWWIPAGVITVGMMATVSRTPIIVLGAGLLTLLVLRPRQVARLLPLAVPMVVVVKLMLPGSIATVKNAFFPPEGIIAQQTTLAEEADPLLAGGRVRQLGPMLAEASRTPVLGQGFATRQTGFDNPLRNAPILDNQWLGLVLETGLVGVIGWLALTFGSVFRLGRASRVRAGPEGWLLVGFAGSIAGFAMGMFTYDSLAFSQPTFVLWLVLALAASLLLTRRPA